MAHNYSEFTLVKCSPRDYTTGMNKTEVLTIRIEEELGQRLSGIATEIGMTRADYLRMVLRLASRVNAKELLSAWDTDLKTQLLRK